jgi:chemotaxis protein MotA
MADLNFDSYPRRLTRISQQTVGYSSASLLVSGVVLIAVALCAVLSSDSPARLFNLEGLMIVLGGTIAATLLQFSLSDVRASFQAIRLALAEVPVTSQERMAQLLELSRSVKERGVLVLEEESELVSDEFLRLGLMLVVDGRPVEDIRRILKTEIETSRNRVLRAAQVWETMGNFAPAMGLIGTLLGLIQLLGSLHDSAAVGPAMSMALVATLYGSVAANLCFFPLAGKLRLVVQERDEKKSIAMEGVLSLARLENPMMLEQRLQSFAVGAGQS